MFAQKIVFLCLVVFANSRIIRPKRPQHISYYVDSANIFENDLEDSIYYPLENGVKLRARDVSEVSRVRRQLHGMANTNPDGTMNIGARLPLAGQPGGNTLSAIGGLEGVKNGQDYQAASGGLLFQNPNGHSLSATGRHIPGAGNQLTGSGTVNLLHTPNHKLDATAFATRTMPKMGDNFNTYGGKMDYMFKDKVGASLGMAHTDLFKKTDYSAMGNFNVMRTPTSSFDLNGGFQKSVSPYIPQSRWQPAFGATYTKYW